jgi:hypothetical protein
MKLSSSILIAVALTNFSEIVIAQKKGGKNSAAVPQPVEIGRSIPQVNPAPEEIPPVNQAPKMSTTTSTSSVPSQSAAAALSAEPKSAPSSAPDPSTEETNSASVEQEQTEGEGRALLNLENGEASGGKPIPDNESSGVKRITSVIFGTSIALFLL